MYGSERGRCIDTQTKTYVYVITKSYKWRRSRVLAKFAHAIRNQRNTRAKVKLTTQTRSST